MTPKEVLDYTAADSLDTIINPVDKRQPLLGKGWAPGYYTNRCKCCLTLFTGDKLASTCAPCAYGDYE